MIFQSTFRSFFFAGMLCASSAAAAQTYTVTKIVVSESYADNAIAVNQSGTVLGVWYDINTAPHGYIYKNGTVTKIDVPRSLSTTPTAINALGDIVGVYADLNYVYHGFIYKNGRFKSVSDPTYESTVLAGINDNGLMCGHAYQGFTSSFVYAKGVFTEITEQNNPYAQAINNSGTVLGNYNPTGGNNSAFLYENGKLMTIPTGFSFTDAIGINDKGTVVGNTFDPSTQDAIGFIYKHGTTKTFQIKGQGGTYLTAINDHGAMAGEYIDVNYNQFGFVRDRGKTTLVPVTGSNYVVLNAINNTKLVAGGYLDADEISHSFIAVPAN